MNDRVSISTTSVIPQSWLLLRIYTSTRYIYMHGTILHLNLKVVMSNYRKPEMSTLL